MVNKEVESLKPWEWDGLDVLGLPLKEKKKKIWLEIMIKNIYIMF